jgi:hypothetical protein
MLMGHMLLGGKQSQVRRAAQWASRRSMLRRSGESQQERALQGTQPCPSLTLRHLQVLLMLPRSISISLQALRMQQQQEGLVLR